VIRRRPESGRGSFLAVLMFFSVPAWAASTLSGEEERAAAVAEAELLVQRGDFAGAAAAYGRAVERADANADLLYNQGTAALKSGRVGTAVFALERAARLAPGDGDVAFNLARALEAVEGELGAVARDPRPWQPVTRLPLRLWQLLALALFALAAVLVATRLAVRAAPRLRSLAALGALLCWLLGAAAGLGTWARHHVATRGDAVLVVDEQLAAREAPGAQAPVVFALAPGHRIQVMERREGFARVRLSNGLEGWVAEAAVKLVEAPGA